MTELRLGLDFLIEVAKGNVTGHQILNKFGYNLAVPVTETPIWSPNVPLIWQSTAQQLQFVSDDAGDDIDAGTGMQKVYLEGLDASWALQTETLDLQGLTPVQTVGTYRRFDRGWGTQIGTYHGSNEGLITITWATTTDLAGEIPTGKGRTQQAHYTIPAATDAYLLYFRAHVASNKPSTMAIYTYEGADDLTAPYGGCVIDRWMFSQVTGQIEAQMRASPSVAGPADILITGQADVGTAEIIASYILLLVDR